MKKLIVLSSLAFCLVATSAMAQGPGGGQMTPEQRAAMMKERVKGLNLGINDVQTDSVVAIFGDRALQQAIYAGANFREMSEEDRAKKTKELNDARGKRLSKAGFTDDQIKKLMEGMAMRPGGGRPGGGGGK